MRTGKLRLVLTVLFLCSSIGTMAFASVSDDQVTSQKIKEADGTSGQNTNSGSGVKTGHIQNGAVTTSKIAVSAVTSSVIANGAVTSAKIADGAVTDAKIAGPISGSKLGTHTHSGGDIIDGTVTAAKIQDSAVTDVKISGIISGSKLGSHTHNGADIVDGSISTSKIADGAVTNVKIAMGTIGVERLAPPANTKIVHTGAADNVNTFNSINAAANALYNTGGVVKIMPGTYVEDLNQFYRVTIEGSGPDKTILRGNSTAHLYYGGSITLKDLTMDMTYVNGQTGVDATNVVFTGDVTSLLTLNIKDSTINGHVYIGNFYGFANSTFSNSTIYGGLEIRNTRDPYNPYHADTVVLIKNVTIASSVGLALSQSVNVRVVNSTISSTNTGILMSGVMNKLEVVGSTITGPTALVNYGGLEFYAANSQIAGVISEGSPSVFKIAYCYDAGYNPIPNR